MIEILNSNLKKLDILRKYTFSQYENKAREIGTFKVHAQAEEENLYLVDKSQIYYILFDGKIFGKIENVKYDSDSEFDRVIELSGRLAPYIFTKRVVKGTLSYSGNIPGYIKTLVEQNISNASDTKRRIAMAVNYTDQDVLLAVSSSVSKQVTGGYLWDEIEPVLEQDSLCLQLIPVVEPAKIVNGVETNITSWSLNISAGVDRRKRNSEGNEAVVFSQSLSNIVGVEYENTTEEYCGVAYVAGEGEAEERKWYEVYASEEEEELSGWNRNELWVDARDIQSETSDGTQISDEEYQKLISQRASEKFAENNSGESYESTVTEGNRQYVYGVDYQIGDFVTVIDDELKITVDAQVTSVTVSEEGSQRITDVSFSYGRIRRDPVEKIKQIGNTSTDNANSVKYLEDVIRRTVTGPNSTLTQVANEILSLQDEDDSIREDMMQMTAASDTNGDAFDRDFLRIGTTVGENPTRARYTRRAYFIIPPEERNTFSNIPPNMFTGLSDTQYIVGVREVYPRSDSLVMIKITEMIPRTGKQYFRMYNSSAGGWLQWRTIESTTVSSS